MKNKKYKTKEIITDGFWYDLTDGGYIVPADILVDQDKAKILQDAIDLLTAWREELEGDEILNEI